MLGPNIETRAILIHHNTRLSRLDITSHEVLPVQGAMGYTLGAGRAFSSLDKEIFTELLTSEQQDVEFIPENVLIRSRTCITWYRKPQITRTTFSSHGGQCAYDAPLPGLIFVASEGNPLRCFAYKGKDRPGPDTQLYYAPLGNVYSRGNFCSGNANLPKNIALENMAAWEGFVTQAENTHSGDVEPVAGCNSFGELVAFFQQLQEKKAKTFPSRKLVPMMGPEVQMTLACLLGVES